MSINYLLATNEKKLDEIIGSALNLHFNYFQHNAIEGSLEDTSSRGKNKSLIKLFCSVTELKNFLDYFPRPKTKTIRGMEFEKLKESYKTIRQVRKKLENSVLRNSLEYYLNYEEKGFLFDFSPLNEIEEHFLDSVFYCKDLIK
jgi:hypothetical protein